jgi:uncharacterized membrane protein
MMKRSEPIQMETDSLVGPKFIHPPVETGTSAMKMIESKIQMRAKRNHLRKMLSEMKKRNGEIARRERE